jgi:hypothetical protein
MEEQEESLAHQRAPPKKTTLIPRSVRRDIYATSNSSSSDDHDGSSSKEHSLNSLHFANSAEEMNELADGDIVAPWSNPYEEEAPELLNVPEPCSFPEVLDSMEKSVEDKFEEFKKISPIMLVGSCSQAQISKVYYCPNINPCLFQTIGVAFSISNLCILKLYQVSLCRSNPKLAQLILRCILMPNWKSIGSKGTLT